MCNQLLVTKCCCERFLYKAAARERNRQCEIQLCDESSHRSLSALHPHLRHPSIRILLSLSIPESPSLTWRSIRRGTRSCQTECPSRSAEAKISSSHPEETSPAEWARWENPDPQDVWPSGLQKMRKNTRCILVVFLVVIVVRHCQCGTFLSVCQHWRYLNPSMLIARCGGRGRNLWSGSLRYGKVMKLCVPCIYAGLDTLLLYKLDEVFHYPILRQWWMKKCLHKLLC